MAKRRTRLKTTRNPRSQSGLTRRRGAADGGRSGESAQARARRAARVLALLRSAYPDATCALQHRSAFELLVATILSAQCTDVRVNQVMPGLLARYPDAATLAEADVEELQTLIRSTGFFRNKARSLIGMARRVCETHRGEIPQTMAELLELPGVARKTANCVLGTWFGRPDGVVVDTHVGRVAVRLGLAPRARDGKDAVRIEQDLVELFPRESWTWLSHALIEHGRRVCAARSPRCDACPLAGECPSAAATGRAGPKRRGSRNSQR